MSTDTILTTLAILLLAAILYREIACYIRLVRIDDMHTADKHLLAHLAEDYVRGFPYLFVVLAGLLVAILANLLGFI